MNTYFSQRTEGRKGIQHHLVLQLRGNNAAPQGPGGHLRSTKAITELREVQLPAFMARAGLDDLTQAGFRLAVDIPQPDSPAVHLMASQGTVAQCPQDWLTEAKPWDPKGPARFFELCADAETKQAPSMQFGNTMLYVPGVSGVFGVMDGDPKAETHFLVLAQKVFGNIMDKGFTTDHLVQFFEVAYQLCQQLGIMDQHVRLVANTGTGSQQGPRVHMHVLSDNAGLPSLFPVDYGFSLDKEKGIIIAPENSPNHQRVLELITERSKVQGFSSEAKAERLRSDAQLMQQLAMIRK